MTWGELTDAAARTSPVVRDGRRRGILRLMDRIARQQRRRDSDPWTDIGGEG